MDLSQIATFAAALLAVLAMIMATAWVLKRFYGGAARPGQPAVRRRNRRLSVVEAAQIGNRHRLLLVRRDDREHLILIGGTTELLIETGIPHQEAESESTVRTVEPRFDPAPASEREPAYGHGAEPASSRGFGDTFSRPTLTSSLRSRIGEPSSHLDRRVGTGRDEHATEPDEGTLSEPSFGRATSKHDEPEEESRRSYLRTEPTIFGRVEPQAGARAEPPAFGRPERGSIFQDRASSDRASPLRREDPSPSRFEPSTREQDYDPERYDRSDEPAEEAEPPPDRPHSRILSRFLKKDAD